MCGASHLFQVLSTAFNVFITIRPVLAVITIYVTAALSFLNAKFFLLSGLTLPKRLLVHLLNQHINVVTHALKIFPKKLVFSL